MLAVDNVCHLLQRQTIVLNGQGRMNRTNTVFLTQHGTGYFRFGKSFQSSQLQTDITDQLQHFVGYVKWWSIHISLSFALFFFGGDMVDMITCTELVLYLYGTCMITLFPVVYLSSVILLSAYLYFTCYHFIDNDLLALAEVFNKFFHVEYNFIDRPQFSINCRNYVHLFFF